MPRLPRQLLAIAALVVALPLHAQAPDTDPRTVQPERPTVATHAHTVAPGYFELETGAQGDRDDGGTRTWSAPTVLKVGLGSHTQLNVGAAGLLSGAGRSGGLGDMTVGLKWRVLDANPVLGDFALLPSVKLPTALASNGLGSGTTDVGLLAIASYEFVGVSLDLNAGYTRVGAHDTQASTSSALYAVSSGFPVAGPVSWVAELFGYPTVDGSNTPSSAAFLTGPTWLVSPALNLDLGLITPLHGDLPHSIYAGLVWNMGRW